MVGRTTYVVGPHSPRKQMARKKLPFWMSFGILIVYPTVGAFIAYQFIPFYVRLRGMEFKPKQITSEKEETKN